MPTPWIEALGQQLGSQTANGILGMAIGAYNDKRQLKQQSKLQELQLSGERAMMDYSMMKQLEMWKATNYGPQMDELKKAGLNPALLYGMGGGGGQSTGTPAGSVTGGQAPSGGREIQDLMGMGMNYELMKAQKENIEAQTENVKADTANKPKTGANIEASTASLTQGVTESKARTALTEIQTSLQEVQYDIESSEINDMKAAIKYGMRKIWGEMNSAEAKGQVDQATVNDKIKIVHTEMIGAVLQNILTRAQTTLTNAQTDVAKKSLQVSDAQIKTWANQIMIAWDEHGINSQQNIQQMLNGWTDSDFPKELTEILSQAVDGIMRKPDFKKPNKIGFR